MGVETALYTGTSGLATTSQAMNVIGNNLANSQTTGFKSDRTLFSDVLASKVSSASGSSQVGRGVNVATVDKDFSQGGYKASTSDTDVAIEGSGLFIMGEPNSGQVNYTRDGAFDQNEEGYLVNTTGQRVQGYELNTDGQRVGPLQDVYVNPNASIPAQKTTNITAMANLNADTTTRTNTSGVISNFSGWGFDATDGPDTISFEMMLGGESIGSVDATQDNAVDDVEIMGNAIASAVGATEDFGTDGHSITTTNGSGDSLTIARDGNELVYTTSNGANFSISKFQDDNASGTNVPASMEIASSNLWTSARLKSGDVDSVFSDAEAYTNEPGINSSGTLSGFSLPGGGGTEFSFDMNLGGVDIGSVTSNGGDAEAVGNAIYAAATDPAVAATGVTVSGTGSFGTSGNSITITTSSGDSLTIARNSDELVFSSSSNANFSISNFTDDASPGDDPAQMDIMYSNSGETLVLNKTSSPSVSDSLASMNEVSDFSISKTIYDSLGSAHDLTTYYTKLDTNTWALSYRTDASEVQSAGNSGLYDAGSGLATFTESGEMKSISGDTTSAITWNNGSEPDQQVEYELSNLTQFSDMSEIVRQEQNGNAAGTLSGLQIDNDGNVIATYSNGQSQEEFRLGLAQFSNLDGLNSIGNNLFAETAASGAPAIGVSGSSAGTIRSNSLEQSNVDIAEQFTNMITTQRIYQANSRTITTADEMLQEVVNLKR